jgi:hypothetical protein
MTNTLPRRAYLSDTQPIQGKAMKANNPYRIFICYSHNEKDETLAKEIYDYLDQDDRLQPIMDKGFIPGTRFRDQLEESIAHAHVFLPLFTPESIKKGWVQQEIGFATAHNIPVLPICKGSLPAGMAGELQCLQWGRPPLMTISDGIILICWFEKARKATLLYTFAPRTTANEQE